MSFTVKSYKTTRPQSGEFQILTRRNAFWVRLRQGIVCDASPVLRNTLLYKEVDDLLQHVYQRDGRYEVRKVIRVPIPIDNLASESSA